ncbi:ATP-dependent Clp protease ATP-binding subunit [Pseudonocardia sp. CA-107938]|uniref:ATP-dependent Clp protease ATP-binding subunit n=1 Tax=Pseudonocardia sp. CA-107938 TaxID=3240021 RepID=UPI003D950598
MVERLLGNLTENLGEAFRPFTEPRDEPAEETSRTDRTAQPRSASTPKLDRFGTDLTARATRGELDPVIGRDAEIEQVLEVLARRTKNNPVLIGDPGVGKSAIVEGIAQRVAAGTVPESLRGVRVVSVDVGAMVAGTKYRGEFEQRLTGIIAEVTRAQRGVVLFVDEVHSIVGAGSAEGAPMDAATLLKPALARGDLQLIGATTPGEYRKHIEKDTALERRFEPVRIAPPTVAGTIEILRGLRNRYEEHHDVLIDDEALTAAATMSDRYLTDRFLPDKAIDLLDRASARARMSARTDPAALAAHLEQLRRARDVAVDAEDYERAMQLTGEIDAAEAPVSSGPPLITAKDVAAVVARSTGIPVTELTTAERDKLLDLEGLLHRRVVGQDAAVSAVADAVRAGRAGLAAPDRPVGSFLFIGPTGVGKTELARALAEVLFGSADALLRFDMSEYADRGSAMRLVGAPPGHLGFDEPGQLTEAVRRSPYAVLLMDEIEKAHMEVTNTLLQVLDAGRLTDAHGRTVDFTNTVVIMTSNLGVELLPGVFRAEFRARIDEVVPFHALGAAELRAITRLLLADTVARVAAQGIALEVTDAAVAWLAEHGAQPELGARPLRRTITRELDRRLSRMIIAGDLRTGGRARADVEEGHLVVTPGGPDLRKQ